MQYEKNMPLNPVMETYLKKGSTADSSKKPMLCYCSTSNHKCYTYMCSLEIGDGNQQHRKYRENCSEGIAFYAAEKIQGHFRGGKMTLGEPQGKKSNTSLLDKDSDDLYSESSSVGQLNIECQNIISSDQLIQDQTLHQA